MVEVIGVAEGWLLLFSHPGSVWWMLRVVELIGVADGRLLLFSPPRVCLVDVAVG